MGSKIKTKLNIAWSRQKTGLEAHLGQILGPSWDQNWTKLEPSWAKMGPSWTKLALSWAKLEQRWTKLEPSMSQIGQDGRTWRRGRPSWTKLVPISNKGGPSVTRPAEPVV